MSQMIQRKQTRTLPFRDRFILSVLLLVLILWPQPKTAQAQWTDNGINLTTSDNVGIGTPVPGTRLDIIDSGNTTLDVITARRGVDNEDEYTGILFGSTVTNFSGALRYIIGAAGAARLGLYVGDNAGNVLAEKMSILSNGNVGIGTTMPLYKLDVSGTMKGSLLSSNRNAVGLEYNILFNAANRYTVTQTGTAALNLTALFDGVLSSSYSATGPSNSDPTVITIENLPATHTQAGAWVGWTSRYRPPIKFKIEGYDGYNNADIWRTFADYSTTSYQGADFLVPVATAGIYTKLRFTFYQASNPNDMLGISELFFIHPEAGRVYSGLLPSNMFEVNGNVGIGTTSPAAKLDIRHTYSTATGGQQFGQQLITEYAVADTSLKQGLRLNPRASQTTGTLTDLIGLFSLPEGRGNGGITTNATSLWSRVDTFSGHTITNAYNLNINDGTGTGTIGTQYGVYVGNLTKGTTDNFALYTAGTTKSYFGGNVGIGTTVPGELLHLKKEGNYQVRLHSSAAGGGFWNIGQTDNDFASGGGRLVFVPNSTSSSNASVTFMSSGNVGIGTTNPSTKLHVAGDVTVTGNIAAKYQDVAEWVTSPKSMPAGTVVMLHPDQTNQVLPSMKAYDTRVAGVVSDMPGILLGEAGNGKVKVATTGRVKVKVDATKKPVQVGDLLVTSDKEGVAMKSEPLDLGGVPIHRPGTLIGKALEPLSEGEGEILVLLSLQ